MIALALGGLPTEARSQSGTDQSAAPAPAVPDSGSAAPAADNQLSNDVRPEWHSMITNLPGDWARTGRLCVQPEGLQTIAGIGVLTGILIATDGNTYRSTQDVLGRNPWLRSGADVYQHLGNGRTHLGIAAAFALGGLIADDSRALRTASQTVEGLLASGVVVQILKHMTGRESPAEASTPGGIWRFFPNLKAYEQDQGRYYAFPSGHIATAMTTVTIVAENYPELGWIRPVGYTLVGALGVTLVGVRFHWYSDLPLGIAIGHAVGLVVARRNTPQDMAGDGVSTLSLRPSVLPGGAGVSVAYSF